MNLKPLFELQKSLDERIVKEKGLEGQDLIPKKILALQVELGELANEWRGFKFWSKAQKPKGIFLTTDGATKENAVEYVCANDECGERFDSDNENLKDVFGEIVEDCPECKVGYLYAMRPKNALLEEYVDCLHFILSIGLEDLSSCVYDWNYTPYQTLDGENIEIQFINIHFAIHHYWRTRDLEQVIEMFLGLGQMLGFTWEQIEQAYMDKNKVNHERQSNGY